MKISVQLMLAFAVLFFFVSCAEAAQPRSATNDSIGKAQNALRQWKMRSDAPITPPACDRCSEMKDRLVDSDVQCDKLAGDMEVLLKEIMTVGAERAGGSAIQKLQDGTAQLETCRVQRDTMLEQQKIEIEKFKKRKWRPDDSREREEMRYYNPNRPR